MDPWGQDYETLYKRLNKITCKCFSRMWKRNRPNFFNGVKRREAEEGKKSFKKEEVVCIGNRWGRREIPSGMLWNECLLRKEQQL